MTFSPTVKRQLWAIIGFVVAVLVLMALLRSDYYQLVLTQVLLWAVMSLAWNILCGYSGYFSFGHAAFWGLGAYTVALGLIHFDLSPWLTIPAGAVVGGLAGALMRARLSAGELGLDLYDMRGKLAAKGLKYEDS